jgi:hypothetical protein
MGFGLIFFVLFNEFANGCRYLVSIGCGKKTHLLAFLVSSVIFTPRFVCAHRILPDTC